MELHIYPTVVYRVSELNIEVTLSRVAKLTQYQISMYMVGITELKII